MQLKPTNIFDIMAMVALYRPGPIEIIPDFIKRKQNPSSSLTWTPDEGVSPGLLWALRVPGDLLLTSIKIAGLRLGPGRQVPQAVGKKIPREMAKQEDKFKKGIVSFGGLTPERRLLPCGSSSSPSRLRLQQGPCRRLRRRGLPDGLPQGALPGRSYMTALMTAESA